MYSGFLRAESQCGFKHCNTASNNRCSKCKPSQGPLIRICWKRITGWVFCTAGLWMWNLNCLLKHYLNVWKVTYFTMLEFINDFSSETASFYQCLIDRFLLISHFFCPTKMSGNLCIFMTTPLHQTCLYIQWVLDYPNSDYPNTQLSKRQKWLFY